MKLNYILAIFMSACAVHTDGTIAKQDGIPACGDVDYRKINLTASNPDGSHQQCLLIHSYSGDVVYIQYTRSDNNVCVHLPLQDQECVSLTGGYASLIVEVPTDQETSTEVFDMSADNRKCSCE